MVMSRRTQVVGVIVLVVLTLGGLGYVFRPLTVEERVDRLIRVRTQYYYGPEWLDYFWPSIAWWRQEFEAIRPEIVPPLTGRVHNPDPITRIMVVDMLAMTNSPQAFEPLSLAMLDDVAEVRAAVACALNFDDISHPGVCDLLRTGLRDENENVRRWATEALAERAGLAAADDIVGMLDDSKVYVYKCAMNRLKDLDQGRLIDELSERINSVADVEFARHAAWALRDCKVPEAVALLRRMLKHSSAEVQTAARTVLIERGETP
jgi:HEAT repeat protein